MLFNFVGLSLSLLTLASGSNHFLDCGSVSFWQRLVKRCCTSDELPKGCECFEVTGESGFNNTLLYKPDCPHDLGLSFLLYTRDDRTGTTIKVGSLSSVFDGSKDTKIVIHGYNSNIFKQDYQDMMNALLDKEDVNVILVNWKDGATPNYYQCAANTRSVGAMTARLIQELHEHKGSSYQSFHLIGHSLGAHASGMAGKEIQRLTSHSLGRITGLDPAGPLFEDTLPIVRLNSNAASFVDVIHSNAAVEDNSGFGIARLSGHVDFYVNGGNRQPGCQVETFNIATLISSVGCSHKRVVKIFIDSINRCPVHAGDRCPMGYHANPSCRGVRSPNTLGTRPYCV